MWWLLLVLGTVVWLVWEVVHAPTDEGLTGLDVLERERRRVSPSVPRGGVSG